MKFLSLKKAAERLNTSPGELIEFAAKGEITLSVEVPPDFSVWLVTSSTLKNGQIEISKSADIHYIDIPKEEFPAPYSNQPPTRCPTYCTGYLANDNKPINSNNLKPLAGNPDYQPKMVKVCGLSDLRPAWVRHPQQINVPKNFAIQLKQSAKQENLELINQINNLNGYLVVLKKDNIENLQLTHDSLLISEKECASLFSRLTAFPFPPDELKDSSYTTPLMLDMNQVAREMHALAIRNKAIYPKPDTIKARLMEMPSFKQWAEKQASEVDAPYKDLADTAVMIIRPNDSHGKGDKIIEPADGYLSEKFKILIATSEQFGPQFSDAIKPSIEAVTKWLLKTNIGKDTAKRAAPLVWPHQERDAGRRKGIKNTKKTPI